jgi:3',5'-cyclic AMP phosphodiesterase CpdA
MSRYGIIYYMILTVLFLYFCSTVSAYTTTFAVISDPHFYDKYLGTAGSVFEAYIAYENKMIRESEAIFDSAVDSITKKGIDFLIIPGDLTKDGELTSHQKFASKLSEIEKKGIKVYIINGNHDINNGSAYTYDGNKETPVDSVTPEEFVNIYSEFGYSEALDRDTNTLSYVVEPMDGLWLLALDSSIYPDQKIVGYTPVSGEFKNETIVWILEKLAQAKVQGKNVIGMMHHGILEHFTSQATFFNEYVVADWQNVSQTFADAGLKMVFTGHFHANDITAMDFEKNNQKSTLYDIETGSLVTYPSSYRFVTLYDNNLSMIYTDSVMRIDYDTNGLSFPEYARNKLYDGVLAIVLEIMTNPTEKGGLGMSADLADQLAPYYVDGIIAHYIGDESIDDKTANFIRDLFSSSDYTKQIVALSLSLIWTDLYPTDRIGNIPLNPKISLNLKIDPSKENYSTGDNFTVNMDLQTGTENVHSDIYFILYDYESNKAYYGLDFVEQTHPVFNDISIPSNTNLNDFSLIEVSIPSSKPPIGGTGKYAFFIAATESGSMNFISNLVSISFNVN